MFSVGAEYVAKRCASKHLFDIFHCGADEGNGFIKPCGQLVTMVVQAILKQVTWVLKAL